MKKLLITILILVVAIPTFILINLRLKTVKEIRKIESIQGKEGELSKLTSDFRSTPFEINKEDIPAEILSQMNIKNLDNIVFYRINNEGLPYFISYIAYNSASKTILSVVVDPLW